MKVIPDAHLSQIEIAFSLSNRIYGQYTTDKTHWATKWIINTLLSKDDTKSVTVEDLQAVNIYTGLWYIISDKMVNGVGEPTMPNDDEYTGASQNVADLVSTGVMAIEIISDGSKHHISPVPANELVMGEVPTRYVYICKEDEEGVETTYLFKKRYYKGYNTNELFQLDKNSRQSGVAVSFESVGLPYQETETTGLETESIFVGCKESMFRIVQSLVFAFERNIVDIETQFYKHLEAWLLMRGVNFSSDDRNPDGSVKKTKLRERVVSTSDPDAGIEYITMQNPALTELIAFTADKLIRMISAVTSIPSFYFGLEEAGGVYGEDASRLRLQDYKNKCVKYQNVISDVFDRAFDAIGESNGSLIWGEVIKKSESQLLEEYGLANDLGIITKKRMVMEYWGMNETDAMQYLAEIALETPKPVTQPTNDKAIVA